MSKTHLYFMPGLAAGPEIFHKLNLNPILYEFHYLTWKNPLGIDESISNYAMRMTDEIKHKKPVLIGVSFGGIIVQEMSKFMEVKKIIIISSVKSADELPKRYKIASKSKIYKLFPTQIVTKFENYAKFFVGKSLEKKAKMYKKYLSVRGKNYIKWSIHNVVNWKQEKPLEGIVHIHGTNDNIFPFKNIKNCIKIEDGNHAMIILRAKQISQIIHQSLAC
ncbi:MULTISPECIES: alpha/beta hydrolase [unclassified Polaribacter]|uniref:alpha/beta hydrolase n=1 Tax=unclassified Polaribacter TaxID=196858 RepID=UPI0011BDF847|nr:MULTISPECIES: alpha/beta hydrolase [unclassified Polaribacter]TXD52535.1 alpha/beta hydrolase [Polaribacter sp. IC063]TXD60521.1 alpha/beta hydrolase [Polaribacter sp. IC066]